ncbi:MAG: hypothetical protein JO149_04260, partial [Gammaproteobacteria bacterium]|nr:hypothetical protein [Gammaproteobacteria bacterium]
MFKKNLPTHIHIPITDDYLIQSNIVNASELGKFEFREIDLKKMLSTKITVEDINQLAIGNCYFLVGLASIVEKDPALINEIIKIKEKNGKQYVEITLHDLYNPDKLCTYQLDPTKIVSSKMNHHTHDAIFLLEKAYAIHRIVTQKAVYNEKEAEILDALESNQFNVEQTIDKLLAQEDNFANMDKQEQKSKRNSIAIKVKHVKKKYDNNYQTYISALTAGLPTDTFICILGVPVDNYEIPIDYNSQYLLVDFLAKSFAISSEMKAVSAERVRLKTILENIFGSPISEEAKYFLASINNEDVLREGIKCLSNLSDADDIKQVLKSFYKKILYNFLDQQYEFLSDAEIAELKKEQLIMLGKTLTRLVDFIDHRLLSSEQAEYFLCDIMLDCFANSDLMQETINSLSKEEISNEAENIAELEPVKEKDSVIYLKKIFGSLEFPEAQCFFEIC